MGEVIHGDYNGFVEQSKVDSITEYELWKSIWSSIHDKTSLNSTDPATTQRLPPALHPTTFIGNHDVTRIASCIGTDGAALAPAILMTVGGIPTIYYGDELGYLGVKEERPGGDDAVRPEFPNTQANATTCTEPTKTSSDSGAATPGSSTPPPKPSPWKTPLHRLPQQR